MSVQCLAVFTNLSCNDTSFPRTLKPTNTLLDHVEMIECIVNMLRGIAYLLVFQVAKFASGSPEWFPYDVGTNLIRNADHTRIHLDVSHDKEKEWTFLVYLTPNWTRNYYGETAFFERNSDDTEIVAEVRPRYGRAVIFQGNISAEQNAVDW